VVVVALTLLIAGSAALDCSVAVSDGQRAEAKALFQQGQQALLASRWSEAEPPLDRAIALDPRHALAHYGLGQAYMGLGRFAGAVSAFSRSREAFRCAARPGVTDEQIQALRDAIRNFEQRRQKERLAQWKEINGDSTTPFDSLNTVRELERRLQELEELRGSDPVPLGVTLALGSAYFQAGALADAEREFRAVLAAEARSGDAHNNLAVVLMLSGRLDEAERELRLAEKAGVAPHPRLKQELKRRKQESALKKP